MRKLGLDPGFGNLTVAEIQNGKMVTATVASVVGIGSTEIGALNLAGVAKLAGPTSPTWSGSRE